MRSSVSFLTLYCLLSHGTTKSWSFTFGFTGRGKVPATTSTTLDLFRRSRLNARSIAKRVDDYHCGETRQEKLPRRSRRQHKSAAEMLRSAVLTSADGTKVRLGDEMGEGRAVVVFLRHLGCPYCWSYAREWSKLQRKISRSGAAGPFFISVGDCEKLRTFLRLNRYISSKKSFVDDGSLQAYESVGLGCMELGKAIDSTVAAPNLGGLRGWWKYMRNVEELTPIEPGSRKFSGGVKQLGGTFIIDGDEVLYEWYDKFPGDTPALEEVLCALVP